jgi:hypothetical protein
MLPVSANKKRNTLPLTKVTGVMFRGHMLIQLVFPVKTLPTELAHWVTSKPSSLLFGAIHFGVTLLRMTIQLAS